MSGLLLNDISEHLPVFTVYKWDCSQKGGEDVVRFRRVRTEKTLNAFKIYLLAQDWKEVFKSSDADQAYESFLNLFTALYDKHCPLQQCNTKSTNKERPWFTKGLLNACRKKNSLN